MKTLFLQALIESANLFLGLAGALAFVVAASFLLIGGF